MCLFLGRHLASFLKASSLSLPLFIWNWFVPSDERPRQWYFALGILRFLSLLSYCGIKNGNKSDLNGWNHGWKSSMQRKGAIVRFEDVRDRLIRRNSSSTSLHLQKMRRRWSNALKIHLIRIRYLQLSPYLRKVKVYSASNTSTIIAFVEEMLWLLSAGERSIGKSEGDFLFAELIWPNGKTR